MLAAHLWYTILMLAVAPEEGEEPVPPPGAALDEAAKAMQLEGLFLFALVWSVGATCDAAGRAEFDHFFRWAQFAE
jgi:dynein heavy chain